MLCLKLSRVGKKKQPFYRIIVLEKAKDPFGDYLELLGNYNPKTKEINLKRDRIEHWLSNGAQATPTVHNLLIKEGIINEKKKKSVRISKKRFDKIKYKKEKEVDRPEAVKEKEEAVESKEPTKEVKEEPVAVSTPENKPADKEKQETPTAKPEPKEEKSEDKVEAKK